MSSEHQLLCPDQQRLHDELEQQCEHQLRAQDS